MGIVLTIWGVSPTIAARYMGGGAASTLGNRSAAPLNLHRVECLFVAWLLYSIVTPLLEIETRRYADTLLVEGRDTGIGRADNHFSAYRCQPQYPRHGYSSAVFSACQAIGAFRGHNWQRYGRIAAKRLIELSGGKIMDEGTPIRRAYFRTIGIVTLIVALIALILGGYMSAFTFFILGLGCLFLSVFGN